MTSMLSEAAKIFERLPILLHADIIRNVLYSGVWSKYEYIQMKKGRNIMIDPYQVLGVSRSASDDEIKRPTGA